MASLLLRNAVATAMNAARILNCGSASRSFFSSWLLRPLQPVSLLQDLNVTKLASVDHLNFLTSCPLPICQPVAAFKSKVVLRKRCKDCFIVRRRGRLYVYCKTHPRHKQRKL